MERRNKITTGTQFEILISELEKKPSLVRGIHRGATLIYNFKQDWEEITKKLNAYGPPVRDCDGWLRVWRDFKFKLKKKLLQKEAEKNGTVDGKFKNVILFPLEEAAAKLIFSEVQVITDVAVSESLPAVEEIKSESIDNTIWEEDIDFQSGHQSTVEEIKTEDYCMLDETLLGDEELMPSTSANSFHIQMLSSPDRKKRKRNRKIDQRQELLEKHDAMQERVFSEISVTMKDIKNILKDSSQCKRKLLEIEEKKLQILQRRNEREEQLFESEMKLKIMEMKIKTKELESLEKQRSR